MTSGRPEFISHFVLLNHTNNTIHFSLNTGPLKKKPLCNTNPPSTLFDSFCAIQAEQLSHSIMLQTPCLILVWCPCVRNPRLIFNQTFLVCFFRPDSSIIVYIWLICMDSCRFKSAGGTSFLTNQLSVHVTVNCDTSAPVGSGFSLDESSVRPQS